MQNNHGRTRKVIITVICLFLLIGSGAYLFRDSIMDALIERTVKRRMMAHDLKLNEGLHAFLIGTGSPLPDIHRAGPCVAVMAGDRLYVVDAGEASARNIMLTGLSIGRVQAVLLTHFHSDHISGLGEMMLQRWAGGSNGQPLDIFGPEGVDEVVAGFNQAFTLDDGYRTAMHGAETFPPGGAGGVAKPFALGPQDDASAVILDENGLKITAFRVDHRPVVPAVGYKFEYKGRTLLISGDTKYSASLEKQAEGADLLIHEAMNPKIVGLMHKYSYLSHGVSTARVTQDLITYHSSPDDVAKLAQRAKVQNVVLYHIIPPIPSSALYNRIFLGDAKNYYDGPMTVGRDGMLISLPAGSKGIETKYLF